MNGLALFGAGVGTAAVAGVATTAATHGFYRSAGVDYVEGKYEDIHERRAKAKPGSTWMPGPRIGERDGAKENLYPLFNGFATFGAAVGVIFTTNPVRSRPMLAFSALGGLFAGNAISYIHGAKAGAAEVHARYGVAVHEQGSHLVETYDIDGNGTLELDPVGHSAGEFLRKVPTLDWNDEPYNEWVSIELTARAADTSKDGTVTAAEMRTLLASFDENRDGLLQEAERDEFSYEYEMDALVEVVD